MPTDETRLFVLKAIIDRGDMPVIDDVTSNGAHPDRAFNWSDLEYLSYGQTRRGGGSFTRVYLGPKPIKLIPHNVILNTGDVYNDETGVWRKVDGRLREVGFVEDF